MKSFFTNVFNFMDSGESEELNYGANEWEKQLPTLWLLGKTGAGKSSLIQVVTGDSAIQIGNGFVPCTKTAKSYEFPLEKPLIRFLDTRGLSEVGYEPNDDIEVCLAGSHALLVVMKVDEVEQSDVLSALKKIKKTDDISHLLIVHTNINALSKKDRNLAVSYNENKIKEIWGKEFNTLCVDFSPDENSMVGISDLKDALIKMLPSLNEIIIDKEHRNSEEQKFDLLSKEILWYSGSAGASDLLPGVGLVSVPAIQGKMLHSLANSYNVEWDKQAFVEFTGTLGTGFIIKYSSQFFIREVAKFIPIYGQTVGAGTAAIISTASTYAIGRVACYYLYYKNKGGKASPEEMQDLYRKAFTKRKKVADNEENN